MSKLINKLRHQERTLHAKWIGMRYATAVAERDEAMETQCTLMLEIDDLVEIAFKDGPVEVFYDGIEPHPYKDGAWCVWYFERLARGKRSKVRRRTGLWAMDHIRKLEASE